MRSVITVLLLVGLQQSAFAQEDAATPPPEELARLYRQLLDEQRVLRTRLAAQEAKEAAREAAEADASAHPAPVQFGLGRDGFFLTTRDGRFQLRIRSVIQADGRAFIGDAYHESDTFLIRRARLYVEGTVGDFVDYRLMPDFAGSQVQLFEAWVNLRPWSWLQLRGGKFKTPFSLERLQQEQNIVFVERSLVSDVAPDRDVGASLHGNAAHESVIWDLAVLNGAPDGTSDDQDLSYSKDFVGRLFFHPLRPLRNRFVEDLGLGFAATWGVQKGTTTSTALGAYKTTGQLTFFSWRVDPKSITTVLASGNRYRLDPQLYYYVGPVGLLAEYVYSSTTVTNGLKSAAIGTQAWNVQVSGVLTGERASYESVQPKHPFSIRQHHIGAVELAARVHELRVDQAAFPTFADPTKSARRAFAWGLQLNWYFTRNVRFGLLYERTIFDGGASKGDRPLENALLGRLQVSF